MNKKDLIWAYIFYKLGQNSQPSPQEPEPSKDLESVDTLGCTVAVIIASAILGIALFFLMMLLHDPHRLIEPAPTQLPMPTECAELDHLQKFYLAIERVVSKSELIQRAESAGFVWREDYDLTDLDAKRTILWIASDPAVIQSIRLIVGQRSKSSGAMAITQWQTTTRPSRSFTMTGAGSPTEAGRSSSFMRPTGTQPIGKAVSSAKAFS